MNLKFDGEWRDAAPEDTAEDWRRGFKQAMVASIIRDGWFHDLSGIRDRHFPKRRGMLSSSLVLETVREIGIDYDRSKVTETTWVEYGVGEIRGLELTLTLLDGTSIGLQYNRTLAEFLLGLLK